MDFLLDTCTFLWMISDPDKLSKKAVNACRNSDNKLYLSTVSCWEIALKVSLGKLNLKGDPEVFIPQQRIKHAVDLLPLGEKASLYINKIPKIHRDPFGRMLVSQAICHDLSIITPDKMIGDYDAKVLW